MATPKSLAILIGITLLSGCSNGLENPENPENEAITSEIIRQDVMELPVGIPEDELTIEEHERTAHSAYFDNELVVNHASVPDIIQLTQPVGPFAAGTWLMYFNDTTQDSENLQRVGLVYSMDNGETWSDRVYAPVVTEGEEYIVADVSIIQLEDGRLRLYYYGLDPTGDQNKERQIFSSISNDGLNFEVETVVYATMEQVNNPEVLYANDQWYLFLTVPYEKTGFTTSENPLNFSGFTEMEDIGILGAAAQGNDIYVYGCDGFVTEWEFDGSDITYLRDLEVGGCDPAPFFDTQGELHVGTKKL